MTANIEITTQLPQTISTRNKQNTLTFNNIGNKGNVGSFRPFRPSQEYVDASQFAQRPPEVRPVLDLTKNVIGKPVGSGNATGKSPNPVQVPAPGPIVVQYANSVQRPGSGAQRLTLPPPQPIRTYPVIVPGPVSNFLIPG